MSTLFSLYNSIQQRLIPFIEENLAPLTEKEKQFIRAAEFASVDRHMAPYMWTGNGRKPCSRKALALAFIAKAVWNFPTTLLLIDYLKASPTLRRLCGWEGVMEVPSASTFSRAFGQFSKDKLPSLIHEAMLEEGMKGRLVGHVSCDATAIEAREKAARKKEKKPKKKQRRGRRRSGEARPTPKRLQLQSVRSLEENLLDLPSQCDTGVKRNSKGFTDTWRGYKAHIAVVDGDIPISFFLTSASAHDSQAGIPLMQMSDGRVRSLYWLGDSAYDAEAIKEFAILCGHVPIIDPNRRRGEKPEMDPAKKVRYRERSSVERVNSNLKDNYGGNFIRVRGTLKVAAHLMFGIIALTATQLFRLLE